MPRKGSGGRPGVEGCGGAPSRLPVHGGPAGRGPARGLGWGHARRRAGGARVAWRPLRRAGPAGGMRRRGASDRSVGACSERERSTPELMQGAARELRAPMLHDIADLCMRSLYCTCYAACCSKHLRDIAVRGTHVCPVAHVLMNATPLAGTSAGAQSPDAARHGCVYRCFVLVSTHCCLRLQVLL